MKKLVLIFLTLCFTVIAQAQFVFSPAIHYSSAKETETTTSVPNFDTEIKGLIADLRFGYVLPMGLYLGGMYSMQNDHAANLISTGLGGDDSRSGNMMGPTVGYYSMVGFYLLGTYHIIGESEASNGGTTIKIKGAKGPQVDIGWVFPLASSFAIGPQFSWSSIEYSDIEVTGSASTATDFKRDHIRPYISLWFMF